MTKLLAVFVSILIAAIASSSNAFVVSPLNGVRSSGSELQMTVLTYNGKKVDFKAGSPLKNACAKLGVKPKYSCKKGDCGSCTISVAGNRIKACVGKVPPEPKLKSLQEKGLVVK
eukprot:CAMPEP_0203645758 /NCGR_PEP_ID=MMETSP0088-20131115/11585_1 /ASSEMBLY_ACC=CAM_ASM_001087 /TAXON_ID=426623 /ORGANISM="Chaetoceros affinis, Strain CCMP159" /LENGTH=114 /DNA_ID=CAMNT_0050502705 /DNA_START=251 /DNA_END=595 /DNA_ORIENTATION=+